MRVKRKPWTKEELVLEAKKYSTRWDFQKGSQNGYAAARNRGKTFLDSICAHMEPSFIFWNEELITAEALKYDTIKSFQRGCQSAYNAARRLSILNKVCAHMVRQHVSWTEEAIQKEALGYKSRSKFGFGSPKAYDVAVKRKILDKVCGHMDPIHMWTLEKLQEESLKYKTKKEFRENSPSAFYAAHRKRMIDNICTHMQELHHYWTEEELQKEALKYKTRGEFRKNSSTVYYICRKRNIFEKLCSHMIPSCGSSIQENHLFDEIKKIYPKTQKLRDSKVKIDKKPYIKGFDIDIYVPELRKGIEFDGTYHHSFEGLKRGRPWWKNEDLGNYHKLKDDWFASKGIQILHVKEENWNLDKELCIKKCLDFLGATNEQ